MFYETERYR